MTPLFIPSKDRFNNSILLSSLQKTNINHYIVVEPQDSKNYIKYYPKSNIVVLPENNKGISYVRQYILDYANKKKMNWIWMIDDDILPTISVINKNNKLNKISLYKSLEKAITHSFKKGFPSAHKINVNDHKDKIAQIGFKHIVWLREYSKYNINCQVVCNQISAINIPLIKKHKIKYFSKLNFREDIDLTCQIVDSGLLTVRFNNYGYDCNHKRNYNNTKTHKNGGMSKVFNSMNWVKQGQILKKRFNKYIIINNGKFKLNLNSSKKRFYK